MTLHEILFLLFSYLLGSIPVGRIPLYLTRKREIRGKGAAVGIAALVLDMMKGMAPIIYGMSRFDSPLIVICGGAAVIVGDIFPIFAKFRGGKGAAAFFGVLVIFDLPAALVFLVSFLIAAALTRFVSAGSLAGVTAAFFFVLLSSIAEVSLVVFVLAVLVVCKHGKSIQAMMAGAENKLTWKRNG